LTDLLGCISSINDCWEQEGIIGAGHDESGIGVLSSKFFDQI